MTIKIKKEVWAVHSEEFGGYDYVSPEGFAYNVDRVQNGRVYLWSINGLGRTHYTNIDIYRFQAEWRLSNVK